MDASIIPSWSTLSVFFGASLLLAVIPGPVVLYVVASSLCQGRRAGVMLVAGASTGTLVNAFATSFGLATLFAASAALYAVFKYVGAAYLIYLGIKTLRASVDEKAGAAVDDAFRATSVQRVPAWRLFRDGFIVALFNPKTFIFFSAFLPQFMTQHGQGSDGAGDVPECAICADRHHQRRRLRHCRRQHRAVAGEASRGWQSRSHCRRIFVHRTRDFCCAKQTQVVKRLLLLRLCQTPLLHVGRELPQYAFGRGPVDAGISDRQAIGKALPGGQILTSAV